MVVADVPIPRAYVFRPGGNRLTQLAGMFNPRGSVIRSHCLAYVLRHPAAGTVLIDTGLHPDASESLRGDFGLPMGILFRGLKPAEVPYSEQLRALGVEPDEVEAVIMTHLHVDHTGGMRLLPNATFVCSKAEWAAAHARGAAGKGYVAHHLPPESRTRLIDFDEIGEPWGPFESTVDLFGEDTVRLIFTPGHTPGHMSLLVDRRALVVGDAVYTLESLREERLPLFTTNDEQYLASLRQLKAFSEKDPSVVLVPTHDPDAWKQLRRAEGRAETGLRILPSA